MQHLDPSHASILSEILQRSTTMPVVEAQDQTVVKPDHVYVIAPNRDMAIFHGLLQVTAPSEPRAQRMPIDAFLRSLADDQGEQAVGIVLSGTGSDGTLGLRAILGAGGLCLVQDPSEARYDGMPFIAIADGQWNTPELEQFLRGATPGNGKPARIPIQQPAPGRAARQLTLHARRITSPPGDGDFIVLAVEPD